MRLSPPSFLILSVAYFLPLLIHLSFRPSAYRFIFFPASRRLFLPLSFASHSNFLSPGHIFTWFNSPPLFHLVPFLLKSLSVSIRFSPLAFYSIILVSVAFYFPLTLSLSLFLLSACLTHKQANIHKISNHLSSSVSITAFSLFFHLHFPSLPFLSLLSPSFPFLPPPPRFRHPLICVVIYVSSLRVVRLVLSQLGKFPSRPPDGVLLFY